MRFITFSSPSFMNRTRVLEASVKLYHPEVKLDIITTLEPSLNKYVDDLPSIRYSHVKSLLEQGEDEILLIGADCVLYDRLDPFLYTQGSIVLTPHVVKPPTSRVGHIYATGHANGDLVLFRKESLEAISWILKQDLTDKQTQGIFYEQTYLSSLPFIYDDVAIVRHAGINYAWYNINERHLTKFMGKWHVDGQPLIMVQFSGYNNKISKHYNQEVNYLVQELFNEYGKSVDIS